MVLGEKMGNSEDKSHLKEMAIGKNFLFYVFFMKKLHIDHKELLSSDLPRVCWLKYVRFCKKSKKSPNILAEIVTYNDLILSICIIDIPKSWLSLSMYCNAIFNYLKTLNSGFSSIVSLFRKISQPIFFLFFCW